jgi:hypothetical protein
VPRFWYQLPRFTDRHRPNVALARINHAHPKTYLNDARRSIVDANFSTLWPLDHATVDEYALLAFLNSAWAGAAMEVSCTVLGGGALKVEAAHLRRLPIPDLGTETWQELSLLGQRLAVAQPVAAASSVLAKIDTLIIGDLVGPARVEKALSGMKQLLEERLASRSR